MDLPSGQRGYFSAFSAGKRKNKKPRALVGMLASYPNPDD
jgi:hypothetical protein